MKSIAKIISMTLMVLLFNGVVMGQEKPTPKEAKTFLDFYYNGQGGGVVLADMKICTEVNKDNEPADIVQADSLKKGEKYNLWMMFTVPQNDKVDGIIIQFNQGGITRFTKQVSVTGSIRYRTWRWFILNNPGDWEIKVLYDHDGNVEVLNKLNVVVSG